MAVLADKVVLITGATSGIGADIARRFAEEGAVVLLSGRSEERGAALQRELGERAEFLRQDIAEEADWQRVMATIRQRWGRLDALVNCAGVMLPGDIENCDYDTFQSTLRTNAGGVFLGCKYAIELMKDNPDGAALVNVASTTALKPAPWVTAYAASKAAILSLTRSIALHCAGAGYTIRCNAVLPGVVRTPMLEPLLAAAGDPEAALAELAATHPIGRLVEGREVAEAVLYYASERSSGVTGSHLAVDGGQTAA